MICGCILTTKKDEIEKNIIKVYTNIIAFFLKKHLYISVLLEDLLP
tara:strand:+ start:874 stop:1011 length:138 start_codon:yes stop_codon:yes gene_type:complete